MGSLGGPEILLVLVLALLLFGPRSLPKIGKTIGRALSEFRKASNELRTSLEREVEMEELRAVKDDVKSIRREFTDPLEETRRLDREDERAGRRAAADSSGSGPAPAGTDRLTTPESDAEEEPSS